jgi:asparagine synthase (glutamine-hydrolysing)
MCGIAGIVAADATRHQEALGRMLNRLTHRGPDDSGQWLSDHCLLGHRRLSIIDLSPSGAQPMQSAEGNAVITFNGEIYDYKQLRTQFAGGYSFQSTSDTEVILAAYNRYGEAAACHLKGMFAYAIWDKQQQKLTAARDRFGEKPFYYARGEDGSFLFASEIKAILASGLVKPVLSQQALAHYLQRLYVHPTETIYRNIHTLPPAHCLTLTNGQPEIKPYWSFPKLQRHISLAEAAEQLQTLLDCAVAKQLVADVEVGAFLSGGLDSSSVVALASRHTHRLKTFSFGFGTAINELSFAREIADKYGTDHTELRAEDYHLADLLVQMQEIYDEPFADSSNIPTYLISKAASRHLKVILTGDGADELLAGYSFWYRRLYEAASSHQNSLTDTLKQLVRKLLLRGTAPKVSLLDMHDRQNTYFNQTDIKKMLGITSLSVPKPQQPDTMDGVLRWDVADYMPGDILVKVDRASMANSLELRAPFLDVDVAEFCLSLPYSLKINHQTDKLVLRAAFADKWTESIRNRGKQGFGAPVQEWLQKPDFQQLIGDLLKNPGNKLYDYIDFDTAQPFTEKPTYQTWILLVLSLWLTQHAKSYEGWV